MVKFLYAPPACAKAECEILFPVPCFAFQQYFCLLLSFFSLCFFYTANQLTICSCDLDGIQNPLFLATNVYSFQKNEVSSLFLIVDKGFLTCALFQFSSQLAAFLVLGHWRPRLGYAASTCRGVNLLLFPLTAFL